MTQHKVIADDSLSAMDEISRVLGKDAVILKTQKINGKIEILGSNNIEDIASSNAKKINKKKNNFSHLFSNHNLEHDNKVRKFNTLVQNQNIKNPYFRTCTVKYGFSAKYVFWSMYKRPKYIFLENMDFVIKYKTHSKYGFLYHVQFDKSIF